MIGPLLVGGALLYVAMATAKAPPAPRQYTPPVMTSAYGMRTHPVTGEQRMHHGIDLRAMQGTPLYPVTWGIVSKVSLERPAGGNSITIDHGNGWRTSYSHLSAVFVSQGQQVNRRTLIGLTGGAKGTPGAGRSTGPHLHFQAWRWTGSAWQLVNPYPLLRWS